MCAAIFEKCSKSTLEKYYFHIFFRIPCRAEIYWAFIRALNGVGNLVKKI